MTDVTAGHPISYAMHPLVESAYQAVHSQFDQDAEWQGYRQWDGTRSSEALARGSPLAAAFNFHYFFSTHYFKARHALETQDVVGLDRLAGWLRYNPYLTVVDIGCGDGAGSIALIESVIRLREQKLIDPRAIQIHCIGVDRNPHGLAIYEVMMDETGKRGRARDICVTYEVCPRSINEAFGSVEKALRDVRDRWQQPSLSHTIAIVANVNDLLNSEDREAERKLKAAKSLKSHTTEPFGQQLASFHYHLFELVPIDHLHVITVDTEPERIRTVVEEMLRQIRLRFDQREHGVEDAHWRLDSIAFENPSGSFWRERKWIRRYRINPYITSTIHIHNRQLAQDARWQRIKSKDNLELAWARARREMLREAFFDETEIRIFEHNLESNVERLHHELEAYAIRAGYLRQTLHYDVPKDSSSTRPRGLTWLEEQILMIAIIQVIGIRWLQQTPWSYAYRLSPDNSPERGPTEYLYVAWSKAWKDYRQGIVAYAREHPDGVVLKTDIKSYFTRILQDRLQQIIKDELEVSARIEWLVEHLVSKDLAGHDPGKGLVQGSTGSGFLANLYLSAVDYLFPPNDAKGRRLFRYVDDIVVVVPNASDARTTSELLSSTIHGDLHLEINPKKSSCIPVEEFLPQIVSDEALDESHAAYEALLTPLWRMDKQSRGRFRGASASETTWWTHVASYRSCLIELGIFISEAWLSRKLLQEISNEDESAQDLSFPTVPYAISGAATRQWDQGFRATNAEWIQKLSGYRHSLTELFAENQAIVGPATEDVDDPGIAEAGRRMRFAANHLGILGLESIHAELTEILCGKPWLIRNQQQLLEDLAAQGYSADVWRVIDFHQSIVSPMASYMSAVGIRALRFLPRLTSSEWQRLTDFMFSGSELVMLTATETWLAITSRLSSVPFADQVRSLTLASIAPGASPPRRLLKNYFLILGRMDPGAVAAMELDYGEDPLLAAAHSIACDGSVASLFLRHEPAILRKCYYSARYDFFDDRSGGSM